MAAKARTKAPAKAAGKARIRQEEKGLSGIDFCGARLTDMQRRLIANYVTPGGPCFHNALRSAMEAGYREATARSTIYALFQSPEIQKIIRANESLMREAIRESAMLALEAKRRRAFFDLADFYEEKEIAVSGKNGSYAKTVLALKPLDEMTAEQRQIIDGVDYKGQASQLTYVLPNREKELNDIIKINGELSKAAGDGDEEETREIIMERITIRETRRAARAAQAESEILDMPEGADL
ncbi:MAG: terminase small subunit [Treponema sp.]|nr:terminase small subunit [Treponema sp.]